jgi:pyrroline-5-carboxylate reductase
MSSSTTRSPSTQAQSGSNTKTQAKKKIAVLGCGKMGTILLESFLKRKLITPDEAIATVQHGDRGQELSRELGGVPVGTDNRAAVMGAAIVLLCVKPQVLGLLLDEIAPALDPGTLVISIAASTTATFIQQKLGKNIPVVRGMRWPGS